jgi:hypothetical protein
MYSVEPYCVNTEERERGNHDEALSFPAIFSVPMSARERGSAPFGVVYSMVVLSSVTVYFVAKSAARIDRSASFFASGDFVLALATTTVLLVM